MDRRRERLRQIAFMFLCMLPGSVVAESPPAARTWQLNGEELVRLLEGKGDSALCSDERCRHLSSIRADAYVQGVADASRGQWCGQGQVLPHELINRVYSHIRQLPSEELKQDESSLIVEGLRMALPYHHEAFNYQSKVPMKRRL